MFVESNNEEYNTNGDTIMVIQVETQAVMETLMELLVEIVVVM